MKSAFYLILCSVILLSCKKNEEPNFHFEYFGMSEGRYVIYDVVSIFHDEDLGVHDTSYYQLKTKWGEFYTDNEGRVGREFYRYTRSTPSDPWTFSDLWTGIIDGIRAELIEENQRKVKLIFSPTLKKEWDANNYNILGEQNCYYRDIHGDTTLNGITLDSTLVVVQDDDAPNLVEDDNAYEMYAKNIGLVYKLEYDKHFDIGNPIVQYGTELYVTYNTHGIE